MRGEVLENLQNSARAPQKLSFSALGCCLVSNVKALQRELISAAEDNTATMREVNNAEREWRMQRLQSALKSDKLC